MYTVKVFDATLERKTAINLLRHMSDVYQIVTLEWKSVVIGLVTDASGESLRARKDFVLRFPAVIVTDCWGHQVRFSVFSNQLLLTTSYSLIVKSRSRRFLQMWRFIFEMC